MGGGGAEVQNLPASGIIIPRSGPATLLSFESFIAFVSFIRRNADFPTACRSTSGVIAIIPYYPTRARLLIRDIPEALVLALEERAAANGRSAEAEHRLILEEALRSGRNEFRKRAARLRARTASRTQAESADLIREDRDSR